MKIRINTEGIEPSLDSLISEELTKKGLPECFGNMIPPLVKKTYDFNESDVSAALKTRPEDEFDIDSTKVMAPDLLSQNKALTKIGVELIQNHKSRQAAAYVKRITSCKFCPHVGVCNELTKNYLALIALNETK